MNKPITKEQAISVNETLNMPGWKILEDYLTFQLESYRLELESQVNDHRYKQGQIATYREVFRKLKEYRDASQKQRFQKSDSL